MRTFGGRSGFPAVVVAVLLAAAPAVFADGPARVVAVTFSPADRIGAYRYADLVTVRAGDPLTPDLLERNLRLLRATGLFAEADARLNDRPDGAEVAFTLRPHLLVKDVKVKGNIVILERDLARMLRLRPAEPFSEEIVRGDIERILRFYEEQGHEGSTVAEVVSREAGQVRVTYRINEGRPRVVQKVLLKGNRGVAGSEILGVLGMSRYTFFRGSDLQRGLDNLRDYYQRRGYLDVRVTSRVDAAEGSFAFLAAFTNPIKGLLQLGRGGYRLVAITVEIDEGRRFEAMFRGLGAFQESDLRPLLTFQRSGFFDEEEIAAGRERILAFYQERGWYLAEVDARADY
jgi:outer membrane protein assembly factor BamA